MAEDFATVSPADEKTAPVVEDAGNKVCPVMGGPVSGKYFVTYQGKRYGLCCSACKKIFLAEPEKYVAGLTQKEIAYESVQKPAATAAEEKAVAQGTGK